MSKKTMISTMLVVAMLVTSGVAMAQDKPYKREPVVDLTLALEARRGALGITDAQMQQMVVVHLKHRTAAGQLKGRLMGLAEFRDGLIAQDKMTRAQKKSIDQQTSYLIKQIHLERDATRMALFHILDAEQKQRLKKLCGEERYLRPGVRMTCGLPMDKLVPDVQEPQPQHEGKTEEQLRAQVRAEEARANQNVAEPGIPEQTEADGHEAARLKALVEAEEAKAKDSQHDAQPNSPEAEQAEAERMKAERVEAERIETERVEAQWAERDNGESAKDPERS